MELVRRLGHPDDGERLELVEIDVHPRQLAESVHGHLERLEVDDRRLGLPLGPALVHLLELLRDPTRFGPLERDLRRRLDVWFGFDLSLLSLALVLPFALVLNDRRGVPSSQGCGGRGEFPGDLCVDVVHVVVVDVGEEGVLLVVTGELVVVELVRRAEQLEVVHERQFLQARELADKVRGHDRV